MTVPANLLEVSEYTGPGYRPLVDYGAWRVAILRFEDELLPENIHNMQRHNETDEVFVLLQGRCILFLGNGDTTITGLYAEDLKPLKLYNVRRAAWHNHTLSRDAVLLIVENLDTTYDNSPRTPLSLAQREQILALTQSFWK